MDTRASILTPLQLRLVQIVCLGLLVLKLAQWSFGGVFMDEAYYWMWGQHPALSYYDHPPLNAWLLSASSAIFGWNLLALRLPVALAFFADVFALYLIARRIGDNWREHFWLTLLLFLTTPVFLVLTNYALPDHILLTAMLFSITFFVRFFSDRAAGMSGTTRDLLLAALCLGLAGLAKYNAAFLGLGVGLFVLVYDRALLRQVRLYLAAAIAIALQAPVIIWNFAEHFASFEFQLGGRHAGIASTIDGIVPLVFGIGITIGPFLLWPIVQFVIARQNSVPGAGFARATFAASTIAIVSLAFVTVTLFHWNLAAYVAMLPFLAVYMRPRWLIPLQAAWGVVFAVVIFVNYAIVPVTNLSGWRDEATAWSYDWSKAAKFVEKARTKYDAGFVAATDYTTTSLLGFALKDPNVVSLDPAREQFDFWFKRGPHKGQDAILYADRWRPITAAIERQFDSITQIKRIDVTAHGKLVYQQRIYLAKGFKPR